MRAKLGENKWANVDVSYTSAIWENHVAASEVFIIPTVISGQGTRQLLSISNQAISELSVQTRELSYEASIASNQQTAVKHALIYEHRRQQQNSEGSDITEVPIRLRALRTLGDFEAQAGLTQHAHDLAKHLVGRFEQLQKVAQGVLADQEEKGDKLTQTPEGVKKLTVSIKCLDTIWADIISSWKTLKKLKTDIQKNKMTLPPVGQPKRVAEIEKANTDGVGEGEKREGLGISIVDSAATVPRETTVEHGVGEQRNDNEPSSAKANASFDEENAMIQEFIKKCQVRDASPNEAASGIPGPEDSDVEKASLTETLVGKESNPGEVEGDEEKGKAHWWGDDDDGSDDLNIICSEPSSPSGSTMKAQGVINIAREQEAGVTILGDREDDDSVLDYLPSA